MMGSIFSPFMLHKLLRQNENLIILLFSFYIHKKRVRNKSLAFNNIILKRKKYSKIYGGQSGVV